MDERASYAVAGQTGVEREGSQRLGDTLLKLMDNQIAPRRDRLHLVTQQWQQLLPDELLKNCSITGIKGATLMVLAKSPAHRFELHLCSSQLLKELAVRCPRAKIEKIDIVVG